MSTLVERQVELEIESVIKGRHRYEHRRKDEGDSTTQPGKWQTKLVLPVLTQAIEKFLAEVSRGGAGRRHTAFPFLLNIAPVEAAYLAIRFALDGAAVGAKVNTVAINLGSAVQDHINLLSMAHADNVDDDDERKHIKRLFRKVLEQVKKATSEAHRTGVWRHVLKKYRPESLQWSDKNKLLVGMKLIELLQECASIIKIQRQTEGRNDTPIRLQLTEEAAEWFTEAHMRASLWEPVHQPMLVPPRDWTSPFHGGYLTEAIRTQLVLSNSPGYLDELKNVHMPDVYNAINTIQRTPWQINTAVLSVVREARGLGPRYRALFVEPAIIAPVRPAGIPEDVAINSLPPEQKEELLSWKRARAASHSSKARERSHIAEMAQKIGVAEKFASEDAIYFPHCLDFRGRLYPFANYLNPQGDDLARGLLQFAIGKPIGERGAFWLRVHLANLFGVDKVSFEERVKWVEQNSARLLACASNPLDEEFWMTADNPWQALAACFEYAGWLVQGDDYLTHLPIAMDGSCSGLQHYSAMLRDADGGSQVNLVPAEKPSDIYTTVAKRAQSISDGSTCDDAPLWVGKVTRKVAKQPTMTYCYSATQYGMAGQIEAAVRKSGKDYLGEGVEVRPAAVYMAGVVRQAIGETVVAAKQAMDFLQAVATLAAEKGLPIRWSAPSGLPVVQEYREALGDRIRLFYAGLSLRLTIRKDGARIDKKRQAAGVAPNFVHACDSAHLMATVNLGFENALDSWACIHDSFGVHACDVDTLHAVIRETFIEQYTPDVLSKFREEIVEQLAATAPELVDQVPPVPQRGTLDLASVREAAYFFA